MANNTKNDKTVTEDTDKKVEKQSHYNFSGTRRNWLVPALIVVIVLLLAGLVGGHWHERQGFGGVSGPGGRSMMHRERGFLNRGSLNSNSNQNQLSGTVTAVDGSTFTIAGNGASNQVQTSGTTQYQGGNQVKVNDTVIVLGTTSNGTFQATEVVINP
jgi:hypothetical protein